MKQKIAILEDQLKAKSTERLKSMQDTHTGNSSPQNQLRKEIKSQKRCFQQTNSKDDITNLQQTHVQHQMKNEILAIKEENIKLHQELRKMGFKYDDVVAQNNFLRNALEKAESELQLLKTDLQSQEKIPADLSANNDRAYKYKSERDFAMTQVRNLQKRLQLLQQTLSTQREIYNIDQSKAYRKIETLEAECTYLQNENARLNEMANATTRLGTHHRQFSESDQTFFDILSSVDVPVNSRTLLHDYQFNDGAAMQIPYMHSRQPSESTESSSDSESYESSTNIYEYHNDHGYQYTDTSIRPGSLSQDSHSQRNSHVFCNWQQDGMLEYSMSLSQPTTDGYLNSQPNVVMFRDPRPLSQEYDQFYEKTTHSPWAQYGMPSSRSLPKELDRNTSHLSVYRSSSLGSRVASQQTTCFYKKVVTANGELNVMCEAIHVMSELHKGEKVVVHRYNNINEYGTVRALHVTINNKPWYVGVELDLPGLYTNVAG